MSDSTTRCNVVITHQAKTTCPRWQDCCEDHFILGYRLYSQNLRAGIGLIMTHGIKSLFLIKYHFIQISTQMFASHTGFPYSLSWKRISIALWHLSWTCQYLNLYFELCMLVYGLFLILILECKLPEGRNFDSAVNAIYQWLGQYLGTNIYKCLLNE